MAGEEDIATLRLIYVGGEPVTKRDAELYKQHFSSKCNFVNVLGATETGIFRHYLITKETDITRDIVPVGYAVEDMEVLLLDDTGREIGLNQIGEIAVKSRYLSPGYWRRPDLTRASFLPDPAGRNKRIYLTGDLGLMRPDGCLEYLGRKDLQVKISGYRIEVSEIEVALLDLAAIKEAVVVAREDRPGYQRLIAYIVPAQGQAPTSTELRRFLKAKLPEYMVPSTFVFLEALPLTPNGKLDRKALPAPDQSRPELENPLVAPRTVVEDTLTGFWAEVLGLDQVGIHDNFFELGGHSLLATQVRSRVCTVLKVELSLRDLFDFATIAGLAERLETVLWAAKSAESVSE